MRRREESAREEKSKTAAEESIVVGALHTDKQQMHAGSATLHPNCFRSSLTPATSACINR